MADRIALDLGDLGFAHSRARAGLRHRAVDDLEIAAAGELLELDQREIGLDAGGVAIHHQADRAGRRDDAWPGRCDSRDCSPSASAASQAATACVAERGLRQSRRVERHRRDRRAPHSPSASPWAARRWLRMTRSMASRFSAKPGKAPSSPRHLGRGGVGDAGHDRGDGGADRAAFVAVIGDARRHQQPADIGVAEARACGIRRRARAISFDGNCAISTEISSTIVHSRTACSKASMSNARLRIAERHQVQRGEIAGRVVEEHVFRARVRRVDRARRRAGVPVVDRGVDIAGRDRRRPRRRSRSCPTDRAPSASCATLPSVRRVRFQSPSASTASQEVVGDAHRVVRVLAGDGEIGLRVPIGVVGVEVDVGIALARELDDALDVVLGHGGAAGELDLSSSAPGSCPGRSIAVRPLAIAQARRMRLQVPA